MEIKEKITSCLGMAQRARRLVSGAYAVEQAILKKEARLIILAGDAKDETARIYTELSEKNGIPLFRILSKEELGRCLGKEYRAVVAVLDEGFARKLIGMLNEGNDY